MAPKTANKSLQPEAILQAVVVADSFNSRFKPLTNSVPRCLLPLVNVPMIEYTLEFLMSNQVDQIFIVCCTGSDQIIQYIQNSRWAKSNIIEIVVNQHYLSIGDVLRDLDTKQVLVGDFIICNANLVSNVDLKNAVAEHRLRREKDKNCIMTMVLKPASPSHPTRCMGEQSVFGIDPVTNECTYFSPFPSYTSKKKFVIDSQIFKKHTDIILHNDLIDCRLDICSIEVPALFTENFDYQNLRQDFAVGILESELLGKSIFCHLLDSHYAASVRTPSMYNAVSKDIMMRYYTI